MDSQDLSDRRFGDESKTICGSDGIGSAAPSNGALTAKPNEEPNNIGQQAAELPLAGTSSAGNEKMVEFVG